VKQFQDSQVAYKIVERKTPFLKADLVYQIIKNLWVLRLSLLVFKPH